MRLSTVFELLLIFLFLAFAASRTIHGKKGTKLSAAKQTANQNRYCQCTNLMCNCCRDFSLPVVSLKGPGCAAVAYLNEDSMRLTMTFGDKVLRNITLAGKRPNPVCMPLPGGVSKFCGRVYGITRDGDHFKACLALELRSLEDLEAALRVSCFRFGPEGVKLEPGRPVPVLPEKEDEDDDDDDDDDYGLTDDDDDDDDDDFGLTDDDDDDDDDDGAENDVDSGDADYTGFSALSDEFLEGFFGSSGNKKPSKSTTKPPQAVKVTKKPVQKVSTSTVKSIKKITTPIPQATTKVVPSTTMKTVDTTEQQSEPLVSTEMAVEESQDKNVLNESEVDSTTIDNETTHTEQEEESEEEDDEDEPNSNESEVSLEIIPNQEENESNNKESNNIMSDVIEKEGEARRYELLGQVKQPSGRGENITPEETERLFPGLTALIRPPSYTSYSFPPVRSARTHRRMRLPPIEV